MDFPFRRVALLGFGLMGGSLARALKALPAPPHLTALSRDPSEVEQGLREGWLDEAPGEGLSFLEERDLVVYATPPGVALRLLDAHGPFISRKATITDVLGLNGPILERAGALGLGRRCVASHPMTGGTGSGFDSARDGLFRGARVWVSPGEADEERVRMVEEAWRVLEAEPIRVEASDHDELMAWVSHLPQLTSNALAAALRSAGIPGESLGPGGKDATRLAGSGPEMWTEILAQAPGTLLEALKAVERNLERIRSLLEAGRLDEIETLMEETRAWRAEGK